MMCEILDKHIMIYFDTGNAADQIGGKLLSTNDFMVPITAPYNVRPGKQLLRNELLRSWRNSGGVDTGYGRKTGYVKFGINAQFVEIQHQALHQQNKMTPLTQTHFAHSTITVLAPAIDAMKVDKWVGRIDIKKAAQIGRITLELRYHLPLDTQL